MTRSEFASFGDDLSKLESDLNNVPYNMGYYRPTINFQLIDEFMAVLDAANQLVAITGPSTSRTAALNAKLLACAPELLVQLRAISLLTSQTLDSLSDEHYQDIPVEKLQCWLNGANTLLAAFEQRFCP